MLKIRIVRRDYQYFVEQLVEPWLFLRLLGFRAKWRPRMFDPQTETQWGYNSKQEAITAAEFFLLTRDRQTKPGTVVYEARMEPHGLVSQEHRDPRDSHVS